MIIIGLFYLNIADDDKQALPDPSKKYNVILIVADALRQDVLGCYGGEAKTPNLDRLAKNGVLFENAYSTSPWTPPSAVSLFTGNYATSYGYGERLKTIQVYVPQNELLCAEVLEDSGYATRMIIETAQASIHDNLQGFEELPPLELPSDPETKELVDSISDITSGHLYPRRDYKNIFALLRYILEISSGESFFIAYWMLDPHIPYGPVDKFKSKIKFDKQKLNRKLSVYKYGVKEDEEYNDEEIKYIRNLYIADVEAVDERVGFIMKMLRHKNLSEETYIVFTSDHGELFGEHDFFGHARYFYEGLVKVPLIITGPGLKTGRRIKDCISNIDLMPTLKDLLRVDYEDRMQGTSYQSLLFDHSSESRLIYFDNVRDGLHIDALRDGNFKLICWADQPFELYDISSDPEEKHNIAAFHPELVRSMFEKTNNFREENEMRQKENVAAFYVDVEQRSPSEKRRILKQLKALGYIQ
jgi:arylsulfatase A-like enzyme